MFFLYFILCVHKWSNGLCGKSSVFFTPRHQEVMVLRGYFHRPTKGYGCDIVAQKLLSLNAPKSPSNRLKYNNKRNMILG